MILNILEKNFLYNNNQTEIEDIIEKINSELSSQNLYFSHLVVDGEEIHIDHENYLFDHIKEINNIEVMVKTIEEFTGSLLVSLNTYTHRAIPSIEQLVKNFYQAETDENWLMLNQLLEGIDWIYQTIKAIDQTLYKIASWDEFIKGNATFEVELPNLLEAIENKDIILIADIIQYEILPLFKVIYNETEKIFNEQK
ncbi:hypothetical protein [Bacillus sp. S/N-304-OC-R1]|uniref:hypothetical protein n=1 Tax=Bacillus sp. S/N-304-OC-R1 TaxID=2758034 RepID=UPI001C8E138A|nr:hypothetical protein [Bacillus sp. S/N-304-OC-R1]MBY0123463.1 hypothetical protein [Bacillus sp. S/N-304-OC-R1]